MCACLPHDACITIPCQVSIGTGLSTRHSCLLPGSIAGGTLRTVAEKHTSRENYRPVVAGDTAGATRVDTQHDLTSMQSCQPSMTSISELHWKHVQHAKQGHTYEE